MCFQGHQILKEAESSQKKKMKMVRKKDDDDGRTTSETQPQVYRVVSRIESPYSSEMTQMMSCQRIQERSSSPVQKR